MTFQKTMSDNIITIYFLDTPPSLRRGGSLNLALAIVYINLQKGGYAIYY